MFNIGLYWQNMKAASCLKQLSLDIWYLASHSGPLPSEFKLCPLGPKWLCPQASSSRPQNGTAQGVTCVTKAY